MSTAVDRNTVSQQSTTNMLNSSSINESLSRGHLREFDVDIEGIEFEDGVARGLIDVKNNTFSEPTTGVLMPLDVAIRKGYVLIPDGGIEV